jgi:hypothetical protein
MLNVIFDTLRCWLNVIKVLMYYVLNNVCSLWNVILFNCAYSCMHHIYLLIQLSRCSELLLLIYSCFCTCRLYVTPMNYFLFLLSFCVVGWYSSCFWSWCVLLRCNVGHIVISYICIINPNSYLDATQCITILLLTYYRCSGSCVICLCDVCFCFMSAMKDEC